MRAMRFSKRPPGDYSILDAYRDMLRSHAHCEKRVQVQMLFLGMMIQRYWQPFVEDLN